MKRFFALLISVLPLGAFAQTTNRSEGQIEAEAANRIANLEKRTEKLMELTEDEKEWTEACRSKGCGAAAPGARKKVERAGEERRRAMDTVTSQIHSEVDTYIVRAVRPNNVDPEAIARQSGSQRARGS